MVYTIYELFYSNVSSLSMNLILYLLQPNKSNATYLCVDDDVIYPASSWSRERVSFEFVIMLYNIPTYTHMYIYMHIFSSNVAKQLCTYH